MKDNRNLVIRISLLIIGIIGLSALSGMRLSTAGIMGGGMMMGRAGMKAMMKGLMGVYCRQALILRNILTLSQLVRNCLCSIAHNAMNCPTPACIWRTGAHP